MQKQAWTILISIFFVLFITGCGTQQSITTSSLKTLEVKMDVQSLLSNDGTLQCNITTNLPNLTNLTVGINTDNYSRTTTSVDNGKATAKFQNIKPGKYAVAIETTRLNRSDELDQPKTVLDVIGYKGEKLKGPYVTSSSSGTWLSFLKDIAVGSKEQINAQGQIVEQQALKKAETYEQDKAKADAEDYARIEAKVKAEMDEYKPKLIVDTNGKKIWKIYISKGKINVYGNYKGTGNFIVKLSNSNQDLIAIIANEIGDYVLDKTVSVGYVGWYYLEATISDGSCSINTL